VGRLYDSQPTGFGSYGPGVRSRSRDGGRVVQRELTAPRVREALCPLIALAAAAACFITGESLPVGLLPQISANLHVSLSATGLLVTLYAGVVFIASAPLTRLTHDLPRRKLLPSVLAVFVVGTLASAAAPDYGWLLTTRIVTATAQAVFWSVAPVAAAGLLSPQARGRAVASIFAGNSVGIVLGIPAGTWLGQHAGWRVPFLAVAGVGLFVAAAIAVLLPTGKPSESHAAKGTAPDRRRYRILLLTTALTVSAFYAAFTYISPYLTRVTGLGRHTVPVVLLASGAASTTGLATGASFYSRRPTVALTGLWALGTAPVSAIAFQALDGLAFGGFIVAAQTAVFVCAPRSTDLATAWFAAVFNAGIAAGPVVGAFALRVGGLRDTALAGALLACLALVMRTPHPRVWASHNRAAS